MIKHAHWAIRFGMCDYHIENSLFAENVNAIYVTGSPIHQDRTRSLTGRSKYYLMYGIAKYMITKEIKNNTNLHYGYREDVIAVLNWVLDEEEFDGLSENE